MGTYGLANALWHPGISTLRSIGRPLATNMGMTDKEWNKAMDEAETSDSKKNLSLGAGITSGLYTAYLLSNRDKPFFGLDKWGSTTKMLKTAGYPDSYMEDLEWDNRIRAAEANSMFNSDPILQKNSYVRNMGISIIQDAAIKNGTTQPTLGSIYNSAVDKISNKLSFGGIAEVGLKTMVANTSAKLFAGALDAAVGLPPKMKQNIIDGGTWAGAMTAILS